MRALPSGHHKGCRTLIKCTHCTLLSHCAKCPRNLQQKRQHFSAVKCNTCAAILINGPLKGISNCPPAHTAEHFSSYLMLDSMLDLHLLCNMRCSYSKYFSIMMLLQQCKQVSALPRLTRLCLCKHMYDMLLSSMEAQHCIRRHNCTA